MWKYYQLEMKMRDKLYGGWPKSKEVMEALLRARGLDDLIPEVDVAVFETEEQREQAKKDAVEKSWRGFKANGNGLYVEGRQIKAMFKEAGNVMKPIVKIKNLKSKIAERLFVEPGEIPLDRKEPDGTDRGIVHAN